MLYWIVYISIFHKFQRDKLYKNRKKNPKSTIHSQLMARTVNFCMWGYHIYKAKTTEKRSFRLYCLPSIKVSRKILFRPLLQCEIKIMLILLFTVDTFSVSMNRYYQLLPRKTALKSTRNYDIFKMHTFRSIYVCIIMRRGNLALCSLSMYMINLWSRYRVDKIFFRCLSLNTSRITINIHTPRVFLSIFQDDI